MSASVDARDSAREPNWEATLEQALAAEVLWDEGVEAARNACVAGAPLAAAAITAAAWYDNPLHGGRAMLAAYTRMATLPLALPAWLAAFAPAPHPETLDPHFVPGFGFVSEGAAQHIVASCEALRSVLSGPCIGFFLEQRRALEALAGPLNVAGLCAIAFVDAGLDLDTAERRYLLLRLAPALAAAQRARRAGLASFPFFESGYDYQGAWPTQAAAEPCSEAKLTELKRAVGL